MAKAEKTKKTINFWRAKFGCNSAEGLDIFSQATLRVRSAVSVLMILICTGIYAYIPKEWGGVCLLSVSVQVGFVNRQQVPNFVDGV